MWRCLDPLLNNLTMKTYTWTDTDVKIGSSNKLMLKRTAAGYKRNKEINVEKKSSGLQKKCQVATRFSSQPGRRLGKRGET